jgi:hypothetical protein
VRSNNGKAGENRREQDSYFSVIIIDYAYYVHRIKKKEWVGLVACMEVRIHTRVKSGKPEVKDDVKDIRANGRVL